MIASLAFHTNSQLKCLTERIRFFALTKLSAVRRYSQYVDRNEAKSGRKRWCADWAILTRMSISMSVRETTEATCVAELMRRYQALTT